MLLLSIQSWPRVKCSSGDPIPRECSLETSAHRPGQCQARVPRGQWKYTHENKVPLSTRYQSGQGARLSVSTGKGLVREEHSRQGRQLWWVGQACRSLQYQLWAGKKRGRDQDPMFYTRVFKPTEDHEGHQHRVCACFQGTESFFQTLVASCLKL